jgi:transcription elongation factor GreA
MSKFITQIGKNILSEKIKAVEDKLSVVMSQKGTAYDEGGNGWHDNFAYEQLIREEAMLAGQLASLNDIIRNATVVSSTATGTESVTIGCIVELEDSEGNVSEYEVVGFGETDIKATPKKLEYLAPIIFPFMEGILGDEHTIKIGDKKTLLTLINIKRR